jgi:hypothetical protein
MPTLTARRLARLFLAAALLLAQQAALAHGIWHLADTPAQQVAGSGSGEPQQGRVNALCSQHQALDAVLGALGRADACPLPAPQQAEPIPDAVQSSAHRAPPSPSSRDPPTLL